MKMSRDERWTLISSCFHFVSNGGHYTRGDAVQYDAWSQLLPNSTWGWDKMFSYMKKVRRTTSSRS